MAAPITLIAMIKPRRVTRSGGLTNAIIRMAGVEVAVVGSCPCSSAGTHTYPGGARLAVSCVPALEMFLLSFIAPVTPGLNQQSLAQNDDQIRPIPERKLAISGKEEILIW
ncbi:hypothetical protein AAFF_G00235020 [Aldrovandia affinis]|uniref:Uncharacterized protein n=1 Tax=Aldrovandia affinis TaxID=143900 RepID=A0AAD7WV07_9TELE|nr:hypothetical protein AAFF_G00235020 [Aldrovandia affinis]